MKSASPLQLSACRARARPMCPNGLSRFRTLSMRRRCTRWSRSRSVADRRLPQGFKFMKYVVGVDIGGTFTDCVVVDEAGRITVGKALKGAADIHAHNVF